MHRIRARNGNDNSIHYFSVSDGCLTNRENILKYCSKRQNPSRKVNKRSVKEGDIETSQQKARVDAITQILVYSPGALAFLQTLVSRQTVVVLMMGDASMDGCQCAFEPTKSYILTRNTKYTFYSGEIKLCIDGRHDKLSRYGAVNGKW